MEFIEKIKQKTSDLLQSGFGLEVKPEEIIWNLTKKEFVGDFTIVVFPFVKALRKAPEQIGNDLGVRLVESVEEVKSFNVIKGFLNLELEESFWIQFLNDVQSNSNFGRHQPKGQKYLVEFSSPNTNKPLHLGHIRNILLGWASSKILEAAGNEVHKVQIVNDRGIHICKSMIAWLRYGNGETPESTGTKGDNLVGKYYVLYSKEEKKQLAELEEKGKEDEPELLIAARELLQKWEAGDKEVLELWQMMNSWVYAGFEETYKSLGVHFDKYYYESETFLLGKSIVEKGLKSGLFYKVEDSSVWVDLEDAGLDKKILMRSDGTSVYITQDLGTARLRYDDFHADKMVYVVGDEQDYHFKVLFEIMKRLGEPYADGLFHLSYGMVNLPSGKMKSREGTVVDADDLIAAVIKEAQSQSLDRGEIAELEEEAQSEIWRNIAMGALKYHILKVNPKKGMLFDPSESVDMQGQTGPYIQNAFVRTAAVFRKLDKEFDKNAFQNYSGFHEAERQLLLNISQFPAVIENSAASLDPSEVAHYAYDLAKDFHRFWHEVSILKAESEEAKSFRLILSKTVGQVLAMAMDLLGIEMPDRM